MPYDGGGFGLNDYWPLTEEERVALESPRILLAHSAETHQKIIDEYYRQGTIRKTAKSLGIAKSTVHDHLRREGLDTSGMTPVEDIGNASPSKGEQLQSTDEGRKLEESSQTGEENPEPLPAGTPPIPEDISPKDLESLQDPQERETPSHRFNLEAVYRYVNLLANGVHPTYAEQAAKQINPDFWVSAEETGRWQSALERSGYNPKSLPLSEHYLFADPNPPNYVQDIYDQFAMDGEDTQALADLIDSIRQTAYLSGINEQLLKLNRDRLNGITDQGVLNQISQDAQTAAQQIAATYNRDLASQVGSAWLEAAAGQAPLDESLFAGKTGSAAQIWANLTAQQREQAVSDAVSQWADDRAGWKADSIAMTEANDAYTNAVMDFASQNGGLSVRVVPDDCSCAGCLDLVQLGDISMDDAQDIDLPLHVGCIHSLEVNYDAASVPDDLWLPVAA